MKKILDLITEEMEQAFADAGYEKELARVTLSNRPDLCEYQCNGAMAGAKKYHKAPITWIYQYQTEKVICCRLSEPDGSRRKARRGRSRESKDNRY